MEVIRIENKDGVGMFTGDIDAYDIIPKACERHFSGAFSTLDVFPIPFDEGLDLRKDKKEWFCAFLSLEQLEKLITREEIQTLIEYGYDVKLLSVEEYQQGNCQILYTKESITKETLLNSIF